MHIANLKTSIFDTPEFVRSKPVIQATWMKLLIHCVKVENGGRIAGCGDWSNETWKQVARVFRREVQLPSRLWGWHKDDLVVRFYPLSHEQNHHAAVQNGRNGGTVISLRKQESARANGRLGGRPRKITPTIGEHAQVAKPNNPSSQAEEREDKVREVKTIQVPAAPVTGRRLHGIPLSVEEVIAYGRTLTPPRPEAVCRAFWAHYEGQARQNPDGETFWITSGEAVVTNWRAKLPAFGGMNESRKNSTRPNSRNTNTTNENSANAYAKFEQLVSHV